MREFVQEFFSANHIVVFSIYGQVFFLLGLAIALHSWRYSRLALARTLPWLSLFGFVHAFHEWGYIFIPLQTSYLPTPLIEWMMGLHLLLLALSYAFLFQFGVELHRPLPSRWRWVRFVPAVLFLLWLWWAWTSSLPPGTDLAQWTNTLDILARYGLGFPGALLSAYGLWRAARTLTTAFQRKRVVNGLRLAMVALVGYAVAGGLLVPPGPFFPANILNEVRVEELTLIPVPVYRSIFGLMLAFAMIRSLEIFQIELDRHLMTLEENQIVLAERARLGRELHDGTLQKIYAAGLLLRAVERDAARVNGGVSLEQLRQSGDLLNEAVAEIRAHIGMLHKQTDSHSLEAGLRELAQARHLRSLVDIDLQLAIPEHGTLSTRYVGHILAIAHEALSNVARHAHATRVTIAVTGSEQGIEIEIADNGQGMAPDHVVGYGLRNMQERARLLGGHISLHSRPGDGTTLRLEIPWENASDTHPFVVG